MDLDEFLADGDAAIDVQRDRIALDLEAHCTTDPACEFHTAPSTPAERRRFDQARGKSCRACLS